MALGNDVSRIYRAQRGGHALSTAIGPARTSPTLQWQLSLRLGIGISTAAPHPRGTDRRESRTAIRHEDWPTSKLPTPYEIFNQRSGDPYSKARFCELAKLYHPDRYHHSVGPAIHRHHCLSRDDKLERYRLVVAANAILCDPVKRRAYDMSGAGWGDRTSPHHVAQARYKSWRRSPDSAAHNATWEDWEQWYQRRDGGDQHALVFMSNGGFVIVILSFAIAAAWVQLARMDRNGAHFAEVLEQSHEHVSKGMHQRRLETAHLSREERVKHFLRQREGWGYDGDDFPRTITSGPQK